MFPVEFVCIEVLQKAMSEIGSLWYENRANVQQEHFASGLAMRRLDALLSASPAPTRSQIILVGCPPNEWHTLTALLLALFLRRRGLNVLYLGANVPIAEFTDTVKNTRADLVILTAQQLLSAATLQQAAQALSSQKIPVAFGGRIFNLRPDLSHAISGHFLGPDLYAALDEIEMILQGKLKQTHPKAISQIYVAAHQAFVLKRAQIEMAVKEPQESLDISADDLETGIYFLGENINAALHLGNMAHVSAEIDWLRGLLRSYGSSSELGPFLQTYLNAVEKNFNGQGSPISEWLASEIQRLQS